MKITSIFFSLFSMKLSLEAQHKVVQPTRIEPRLSFMSIACLHDSFCHVSKRYSDTFQKKHCWMSNCFKALKEGHSAL